MVLNYGCNDSAVVASVTDTKCRTSTAKFSYVEVGPLLNLKFHRVPRGLNLERETGAPATDTRVYTRVKFRRALAQLTVASPPFLKKGR